MGTWENFFPGSHLNFIEGRNMMYTVVILSRKFTYMIFGSMILLLTACSSPAGDLVATSTSHTLDMTTQTVTPLVTATPTPAPPTSTPPMPTEPVNQSTPTPERINFATGATSATLVGHLGASGSDFYVLRALEGQTMTVELFFTQGQAILAVWGADGTVLLSDHAEVSHFSQVLPSTQNYYISVKGRPEGSTNYSMKVTIPPLPSN